LTWLNLIGNQISDFNPLKKLTNLTYLDLAGNEISPEQIEVSMEQSQNVDRFIGIVRKHTDIRGLDATIIRELVEKIVIHERIRVDGKRTQRADIHYNFIGIVDAGRFPADMGTSLDSA
jgi:hypothetical protein